MSELINGYEIKLIDETRIEAIPNKHGLFEFEIDDFLILITNGDVAVKTKIDNMRFVPEILSIQKAKLERPSADEFARETRTEGDKEMGAFKTCIRCGGRNYCIINGCARTPCGSICDSM
ncbi:MAG: hypothetical protein KKG47_01165 [Proteobacteria bacterium]|nr:hypothetical protein [Pseudomonadota bacterium]MBU1736676.1 hypothetical protein [Pseudomonadota bacterium]